MNRLMRTALTILLAGLTTLLAAALSTTASAATLYVGPNGNDGRGNGEAQNRNTPFRTIQNAIDRSSNGDEIVVLDGTYNQRVFVNRSGSGGGDFVLRSENKEGARVLGAIQANDQSFITIDGFDVTNSGDSDQTKGIQLTRCDHVTVRNCRVRDCYGGGIGFDQSDWILCEWNITHNNAYFEQDQHSGISVYQPQYRGNDSRQYGVVIRNNTSFGNQNFVNNPNFGRPTDGNGIAVDDFKNQQPGGGQSYDRQALIENNLCFDNGGQGVHCYLSQNVRIRNNTCRNNMASFDFGGEVSVSESERVYVYNNILVARPGRRAALQFASQNFGFFFNVIDGPVLDVPFNGSNIYGPAGFEGGGFTLAADSPAVNSAFDAGDHFFLDVNGQDRFNGPLDRGANER